MQFFKVSGPQPNFTYKVNLKSTRDTMRCNKCYRFGSWQKVVAEVCLNILPRINITSIDLYDCAKCPHCGVKLYGQ